MTTEFLSWRPYSLPFTSLPYPAFDQCSVCLLIWAVRSILSQLKGLPSTGALGSVFKRTMEKPAIGESLEPDVEESHRSPLLAGMAALEAARAIDEVMKSMSTEGDEVGDQLEQGRQWYADSGGVETRK